MFVEPVSPVLAGSLVVAPGAVDPGTGLMLPVVPVVPADVPDVELSVDGDAAVEPLDGDIDELLPAGVELLESVEDVVPIALPEPVLPEVLLPDVLDGADIDDDDVPVAGVVALSVLFLQAPSVASAASAPAITID